jgi:hypothetical protein
MGQTPKSGGFIGTPKSSGAPYEHGLADGADGYIAKVPSQVVEDAPADIPRSELPEYITDLIRKRSTCNGRIRRLRII